MKVDTFGPSSGEPEHIIKEMDQQSRVVQAGARRMVLERASDRIVNFPKLVLACLMCMVP